MWGTKTMNEEVSGVRCAASCRHSVPEGSYNGLLHGSIKLLQPWHPINATSFFLCTPSNKGNRAMHAIWHPQSLQHSHFIQIYFTWWTVSVFLLCPPALTVRGSPEIYRTKSWLHKIQWQKLPGFSLCSTVWSCSLLGPGYHNAIKHSDYQRKSFINWSIAGKQNPE